MAHADRVAYRQGLANVLVNLAHHYRTRGASHEMLEYERHALALREQLAAEYPESDVLQLELAQSCTNVGIAEPDARPVVSCWSRRSRSGSSWPTARPTRRCIVNT